MHASSTTDTSANPAPQRRFFGALHNRNFRYLWFAFVAASCVQRMDGVVLGWLILELTDSAFLVGLSGSLRFMGAMFGPVTGVVADRYDRRQLLLASLLAMTAIVSLLLFLVIVRRLEVWHLFATTTIWGVLWAIYQPSQQSLQADVLSGRQLVNGIAWMNSAMNITTIIGPALAGALLACCRQEGQILEWSEEQMMLALNKDEYQSGRLYAASETGAIVASGDHGYTWSALALALPRAVVRALATAGAAPGVQWAYLVLFLLHVVQLGNYLAVRVVQRPPSVSQTSVLQNLLEGLRYSCRDAGLWTALALAGLVNLLAFPLQFGLLPVFARDVFSVGAAELGLLGSALGVGSLLGSLCMMVIGTLPRAGRLMVLGTLGWMLFLLLFGLTQDYYIALGILILMGIAQTLSLMNMSILLLGCASSDMRGRVMGLRSLAVAPLFLGGTASGALTASIGAPLTTIIFAAGGLLITLWIMPWVPANPTQQDTVETR